MVKIPSLNENTKDIFEYLNEKLFIVWKVGDRYGENNNIYSNNVINSYFSKFKYSYWNKGHLNEYYSL